MVEYNIMKRNINKTKELYEQIKEERENFQLSLRKKRHNELIMKKRFFKEDSEIKEKTKVKYEINEDSIRGLNSSIINLQFDTEAILIREMKRLLMSENVIENKYAILVIRKYSLVDKTLLIALFNSQIDELLFHILLRNINDTSIIVRNTQKLLNLV